MGQDHYDLIVIGSGPAGEKGAAQAAYFGKRVALIEKEPHLGGAAANTGTLPSKTLRETALFLTGFRRRELYGLRVGLKDRVLVQDFLARERQVKDCERKRVRENLHRHRVTVYRGTASFVDPHTVSVQPDRCPPLRLTGDVVLIATGSYPYRPPGLPFHDPRLYDSDSILALEALPGSLLVVGGGVVGCEYACIFAALGAQVTVVEKRGGIVGGVDAEVAKALREQMEGDGVRFFLEDAVAEIDGDEAVEVRLESGARVRADAVLVSSGRCGQTASLGLDRIGVQTTERGLIPVDAQYRTSVPNVYAAGDVVGSPALASTSMEQARLAMIHAFDLKYRGDLAPVLPYGIYTIPECAAAGATEEELRKANVPYVAGRASYAANARGQIIGDQKGFLKLLFREDDLRLLGVHLIGELATELVHVGLTVLLARAGADLLLNTCYSYPTLAELYKYATYDALGQQAARRKEREAPPASP
jgi:NAD(P) transhydrogenase